MFGDIFGGGRRGGGRSQVFRGADLRYDADPRFTDVPVKGLLSKEYAAQRRALIKLDRAARTYDAGNPAALKRLAAAGTKFFPFPADVMEASFKAANQVYAEINASNPAFKKIYDSWKAFRAEEVLWFRVVENTFDNFMARQSAASKL